MKLPSFPRKALEADLDLYKGGEIGKVIYSLQVIYMGVAMKATRKRFLTALSLFDG